MISVYSDGSSTGRSNQPGGWAFIIVKNGNVLHSEYGGSSSTTNNIMELTGAIQGLKALINKGLLDDGEQAELVSDSQYVLGLASGDYSPKKNVGLATELRRLAMRTNVALRWVKGHSNDLHNEQCDVLAKKGKEENSLS